jgi:hypothetical protein
MTRGDIASLPAASQTATPEMDEKMLCSIDRGEERARQILAYSQFWIACGLNAAR